MGDLFNKETGVAKAAEPEQGTALNASVVMSKVTEILPVMRQKAQNALFAMRSVGPFETDEQDKKVEIILQKVKITYDELKGMREPITKYLDGIKELLMEPEKVCSFSESHKGEALRLIRMRNGFLSRKLAKAKELEDKLKLEEARKVEIARLKAVFENKFFEGVINTIDSMSNGIADYFKTMTLENFEEKSKKFNLKPTLSKNTYESWFVVEYNKSILTAELFEQILSSVQTQFSYDKINEHYVEKATPIVDEWKAKLPAKLAELKELDILEKSNAEAAALKKKEIEFEEERLKNERLDKSKAEINDKKMETELEANIATQDASFETQIALQTQEDIKGVRRSKVATITGDPTEIVKIMSKVMFACFTNPTFPGYIKAAPEVPGERPTYSDWVEELLSFYAKSCTVPIEGVKVEEVVKKINRKASA